MIKKILFILIFTGMIAINLNAEINVMNNKIPLVYKTLGLTAPVTIDGNWNKPVWNSRPSLTLNNYMGETPEHFPHVQAKLAWDNDAVYVIFNVNDQYVRAVADHTHGAVYQDSCVEFFFTPGTDLGLAYFNLETNCGGTMLFSWHPVDGEAISIAESDCDKITISHTLPTIVEPEIENPTTWTLEYRLPFEIIKKYCPNASKPAKGVTWKANLYKCADKTSHPHWLTWSFIDYPEPKFHMPQYFGMLKF